MALADKHRFEIPCCAYNVMTMTLSLYAYGGLFQPMVRGGGAVSALQCTSSAAVGSIMFVRSLCWTTHGCVAHTTCHLTLDLNDIVTISLYSEGRTSVIRVPLPKRLSTQFEPTAFSLRLGLVIDK